MNPAAAPTQITVTESTITIYERRLAMARHRYPDAVDALARFVASMRIGDTLHVLPGTHIHLLMLRRGGETLTSAQIPAAQVGAWQGEPDLP